jgi:hypothetical protein
MAKKEISELKKRALLAKQRLKMGYWQRLEKERQDLNSALGDAEDAKRLQREKVQRDVMLVTDAKRARSEERFYEKVCKILSSDEDTLSPIGQLIDKEVYQALDDGGRQRYVLELSRRFRELSARYYLEQKAKMNEKKP